MFDAASTQTVIRVSDRLARRATGGIVRPMALAVLLLITNSNVVGCSTGRSPGFAPFKILSTYAAACLHKSGRFGPYDMRPPASTYIRAGYTGGQPARGHRVDESRTVRHEEWGIGVQHTLDTA